MTLAGLTSKFMMIDVYDSVHKNYQLVCIHVVIREENNKNEPYICKSQVDLGWDSPFSNYKLQVHLGWDSPATWLATAIFLDLGYYLFHRASHEVSLYLGPFFCGATFLQELYILPPFNISSKNVSELN